MPDETTVKKKVNQYIADFLTERQLEKYWDEILIQQDFKSWYMSIFIRCNYEDGVENLNAVEEIILSTIRQIQEREEYSKMCDTSWLETEEETKERKQRILKEVKERYAKSCSKKGIKTVSQLIEENKPKRKLKKPKVKKSEDSIDWSKYRQALENEYTHFKHYLAGLIELYDYQEDDTPRRGAPSVPMNDILFSIIMKAYVGKSTRNLHGYLTEYKDLGFISRVPSTSKIDAILNDEIITPILKDLLILSAAPLAPYDRRLAVDSSGFTDTANNEWLKIRTKENALNAAKAGKRNPYKNIQKNDTWVSRDFKVQDVATLDEWFDTSPEVLNAKISDILDVKKKEAVSKKKMKELQEIKRSKWTKAHVISGIKTNVVVGLVVTKGNVSDMTVFNELLDQAEVYFHNAIDVSADMGYSSRENYTAADRHNLVFWCPFKSNVSVSTKENGHPSWSKARKFIEYHAEEFNRYYSTRNNVESVFSSIKTKLGENLRAKTDTTRENYLYCKFIAYNILVLIRTFYLMDIYPVFEDTGVLTDDNGIPIE